MEDLEKKNDDFLYMITHDLKAPLRAITSLSYWIQDDLEEGNKEEVNKHLEMINDNVMKMNLLLNSLTDLSRVKRFHLDQSAFSLEETLSRLKEDIEKNILM